MAVMSDKTRSGHGMPDRGKVNGASQFAGAALMLSGPLSILMGVAAIVRDSLFFSSSHYAYRFGLTSWGVIHLVIGVALVVAALGILTNTSWGRGAGIAAAGISLISQFMFVPYYPVWAIPVMALDLVIVFALTRLQFDPDHDR
ncbi:hypothetical protein [Streptomyces sp. NPDC056061]|uniref:DUF7144 family membrane protein n=1 Tax=Streptomyces sp. NPDC056061 TaxID=3345700 RepID=UPI0035D8AE28